MTAGIPLASPRTMGQGRYDPHIYFIPPPPTPPPAAASTGAILRTWAGDRQGKTWSGQGNILVGQQVVEAMGRAFEETQGELAERLFAALKAGDAAGGDGRGKQSASMLVVRKQGGRNINNDRYIYINVDDNPQPFPELRRLLDMNLGLLYQDKTFKLLRSGKTQGARDVAAQAAHYFPDRSDVHLSLGMLNYAVGDKKGALAAFRAAQAMAKQFRKQFDAAAVRPANKAILEDKAFLKELFPE